MSVSAVPRTLQAQGAPSNWTLNSVIATVEAQHPLVEVARAKLNAAQGAHRTAGSLSNPTATYWFEHGTSPVSNADLILESQLYLTFPLEQIFQRASRVRRADEDVRAAEAGVKAVQRQVALDAAGAFFRMALAQVSVEAARQNRDGLRQLVDYNAARVKQGVVPELESIRATVEYNRASASWALAQVEFDRSRAELWVWLNQPGSPPASFGITPPTPSQTPASLTLDQYMTQALERRPELIAAKDKVAAATAEIQYQKSQTVRQVGASFGVKRSASVSSLLGGVNFSIPVFDQNQGEVQRASGDLVAAQKELAWIERTVQAEVQGALDAAIRLSAELAAVQSSFVVGATDADRITLAAYQQGAATLLEVLDTSRALADTRLTYYRLVFAQQQSLLNLALAIGNDPATSGGPSISELDRGDAR